MIKLLLFFLPFLTAFTAWLTAWVLLYMVLYPLTPKKLFGITLQGFIPRYQHQIAIKVAEGIVQEMATGTGLRLTDPKTLHSLRPMIEHHLDSFLRVKLKEKMPVIAAFIGENTIVKLKEGMMEEIEMLLPEVIARYTSSLTTDPALSGKISGFIANYPPAALQQLIDPYLLQARKRVPMVFAFIGLLLGIAVALTAACLQFYIR